MLSTSYAFFFHLNEANFKPHWYLNLNILSNHSKEEAWSLGKDKKKIKFDVKIQDFTNFSKYLLI